MSKTVIADIHNNSFPELRIKPGTYVVWRNLDPYPHSAETQGNAKPYFSAGALLPGEASSPVLFQQEGEIAYICRFHMGMAGSVVVSAAAANAGADAHDHDGHGHHLQHFHGFVTGGRAGTRFFMTHTPVIADERHHFQVILQGSLTNQKHIDAYNAMRKSNYGDGKVQIFHDHLALPDIGSGAITLLPESSFEYYPDGKDTPVPGLEENIPVKLDRVIHFHTFDPDTDYPDGLSYIVYGDADDIFIDHYITRAPNFHSVAKLKTRPEFWPAQGKFDEMKLRIPSKRILDVSPKLIKRVAYVDNSFHVFWLPPVGVYPFTAAQDPLVQRDGSPASYEVVLVNGQKSSIEIGRFLHFDVRLLNYGVLIT